MAISRKSDGSLGLNDILIEIGAQKGDVIDFISLADALGVSTSNIVLPDSFIGKTLSLKKSVVSELNGNTFDAVKGGTRRTMADTLCTSNGIGCQPSINFTCG